MPENSQLQGQAYLAGKPYVNALGVCLFLFVVICLLCCVIVGALLMPFLNCVFVCGRCVVVVVCLFGLFVVLLFVCVFCVYLFVRGFVCICKGNTRCVPFAIVNVSSHAC